MPHSCASCGEPSRSSSPSSSTRPAVSGRAPVIALISVDLPAPFSPIRECTSPGKSRKSTAASTPKRTVAPLTCRMGRCSLTTAVSRSSVETLALPLRADHDQSLDDDEQEQQQADDDAGPRLLGAHERDDGLDDAEHEHA